MRAFLSGGAMMPAAGKVIGMGTALRIDPTLRSVADLRPGWIAGREQIGAMWVYQPDPDV